MPGNREKDFKEIMHFNESGAELSCTLGIGIMEVTIPVSLRTLQMLNTKFGKELPSIS